MLIRNLKECNNISRSFALHRSGHHGSTTLRQSCAARRAPSEFGGHFGGWLRNPERHTYRGQPLLHPPGSPLLETSWKFDPLRFLDENKKLLRPDGFAPFSIGKLFTFHQRKHSHSFFNQLTIYIYNYATKTFNEKYTHVISKIINKGQLIGLSLFMHRKTRVLGRGTGQNGALPLHRQPAALFHPGSTAWQNSLAQRLSRQYC